MNRFFSIILLFLILSFVSCYSTPYSGQQQGEQHSAQSTSQFWTGDGGKGRSIAILAPVAVGLAGNQNNLPSVVQGEFVSNFTNYSAISVLDRANLGEQYAELFSGWYDDNTDVGRDLGRLPPTDYLMAGNITRTATGYALQIRITRNRDKITEASYSGTFTFEELDNLTGIRRASLDLLQKMGVELTERTKTELTRPASANRVSAQTAMAQGLTAERAGTESAALGYYFQAAALDPTLLEAASRMSVVSASISGGNVGQAVRSRLQIHDEWREIVTAANSFYSSHLPYEFIYSDVKDGRIDYETRTIELSVEISLLPTDAWKVVNNLRQGLRTAQGSEQWNFSLSGIGPQQIVVAVEIINAKNAVLSTASHTFRNLSETERMNDILVFRNVRADDIIDGAAVRITSVNRIPAQRAVETGYIRITSLHDFDIRMEPIRRAEEAARIAQEKRERSRFKWSGIVPWDFDVGYNYTDSLPLGFRVGVMGFYFTMNLDSPDWQGNTSGRLSSYHYDRNGAVWRYNSSDNYSRVYNAIDTGIRETGTIEYVIGFSFNILDDLLSVPIGLGWRSVTEYGLFNNLPDKDGWARKGKGFSESDRYFLWEVGLTVKPMRWIAISATHRFIISQENNFAIGISFSTPRGTIW